jgi:hypothetical protein
MKKHKAASGKRKSKTISLNCLATSPKLAAAIAELKAES